MNQLQSIYERSARVPLTWKTLNGENVSETQLIDAIRQMSLGGILLRLVGLLQICDVKEQATYGDLDHRVSVLFPSSTASRIASRLSQERPPFIFFSRWQLLLAIKLVCTFASRDTNGTQITDNQLLKLLLMTNGFYPGGDSATGPNESLEDLIDALRRTALQGYSLVQGEHPMNLIGRYAELFGRLAAPENRSDFNTWVDIHKVLADELGIKLDTFKAVLFALFSSTVSVQSNSDGVILSQPVCLNPETYFADTQLDREEVNRILQMISTSDDEVKEHHQSSYADGIGNPVDLGILLRKPVIRLSDGSVVGISGQLLIQRFTCGLYWDIHDALSNDPNETPNRRLFQTFFGELHERYGSDILRRVEFEQIRSGRQIRLLSEADYSSVNGSNPDSLLIETIGSRTTRCTLFEFKVGRPRYRDSIVEGDIQAFEEDLKSKIEEGFNQELNFARQLLNGSRTVPNLSPQDVTAWIFVIVVTDPFPSMGLFLEQLRTLLTDSSDLGNANLYGPLVLSLKEFEQLETITTSRVSQTLIDWTASTHREWPFNTYYAYRTEEHPISNSYVSESAEDDFEVVTTLLSNRIDL